MTKLMFAFTDEMVNSICSFLRTQGGWAISMAIFELSI
ncbi:hypothetical protein IBT54_000874 [Pantoea sp. S62]|nr:hypothetical protein [Pantoea sp. S62]